MKTTDDYVEFKTTTGTIQRVYKKDNPSLYFLMGVNSDDGVPFGASRKNSQEDYVVYNEDY